MQGRTDLPFDLKEGMHGVKLLQVHETRLMNNGAPERLYKSKVSLMVPRWVLMPLRKEQRK